MISLKDVIYWIAESWDLVSACTIKKSWNKLLNTESDGDDNKIENDDYDFEDLQPLIKLIPECRDVTQDDIIEWNNSDEICEISDSDLVNIVQQSDDDECENDEVDAAELSPKISHQDGYDAITKALDYVEQQTEATPTDVLFLQRWRSIAAKKRQNNLKQSQITQFFK